MTNTATLAAAPLVCTEGSCLHASPFTPCECSCGGVNHGLHHAKAHEQGREQVRQENARPGGVFARLAVAGALATDDEPW